MRCDDCKELFPVYFDNEVTQKERLLIETHISTCIECAKEAEEIKAIMDELSYLPMIALPENYHEELMAKLTKEVKVIPLVAKKRQRVWKQFSVVAAAALLVVATGGLDGILDMRPQQGTMGPSVSESGDDDAFGFMGTFFLDDADEMTGGEPAPEGIRDRAESDTAYTEDDRISDDFGTVMHGDADTDANHMQENRGMEPFDGYMIFNDVASQADVLERAMPQPNAIVTVVEDDGFSAVVAQVVESRESSTPARSIISIEEAEVAVEQVFFKTYEIEVAEQLIQNAMNGVGAELTDRVFSDIVYISVPANRLDMFYALLREQGVVETISSTYNDFQEGSVIVEIQIQPLL